MIFDFLKKKKAEENSEIPVKIEELDRWFEENSRGKRERISFLEGEIYKEINEAVNQAKADLKGLEECEIRKADERIVNIVRQQRKVYVTFAEGFLEDISKKQNAGSNELLVYYLNRSSSFSRHSFKSFHATSELIGKPLEKLLEDFKNIDLCFKKINELIKTEISKVDNLGRLINEINRLVRLEKENAESIEKTVSDINDMDKKISILRANDEAIKKSDEYLEKEKLREKINRLSNQIKLKKEEIASAFSRIQKGLKRLEWTEQNKHNKELLNKLIGNTWDTLRATDENQIICLFEKLAEKAKNNEINEISIGQIEKARYSLKVLSEVNYLEAELNDAAKKEEEMKINWSDTEIKELEEEIRKNSKLKENCKGGIRDLALSIDALKGKIRGRIAEYLGKQVEILF